MSDWNLEPGDMAIHAGVAFAGTALLGYGASFLPHPISVILLIAIAVSVLLIFYLREMFQQMRKNTPPTHPLLFWTWGPRGIAEFTITIPAVIAAVVLVALIG